MTTRFRALPARFMTTACAPLLRVALGAAVIGAALLSPRMARAEEVVIVTPAHESRGDDNRRYLGEVYPIEIEPHFAFGADNVYGASGYGAGLRLSIPLAFGHIGRVPDNVAISFGGDILHYDNCYYGANCGANYLLLPVAAQWNLNVLRGFSIFGEAGVFVYKGWLTACGPGDGPNCSAPSDFGLLPTVAVGGRVHIGENAAFTFRLGYPTTTLGVSFL